MKRLTALLCALILCLLCACGGAAAPYSPDLVDKFLEHDVFSEPLEPLDAEIACLIYQLDPEQVQLTDLRALRSAGATCEEIAVLIFETEADASTARSALEGYLAARLEDCRDYMPDQVPKLEHAILSQHTNTILLAVTADWITAISIK